MSGSTSTTITVPSPPTTAEVAADFIAWVGGQTGVLTDVNPGSQMRTEAEAAGSVVEMQGVVSQAQAFQAMVYAAWAAFNIYPYQATSAVGQVTFTTGSGANQPTVPYDVLVPAGTIVQTVGGIQFTTTTAGVIPTGGSSVTVQVQASVVGAGGNVPAGAIQQIVSGLSYPLQVSNAAPTTGGEDVETAAQTMARFTAAVASIGLGSPVAIANFCIGVAVSGTAEKVMYATVYEPWVDQIAAGVAFDQLTPGFYVYVDNGSGSASSNLLTAVQTAMNGDASLGEDGNRPAGVPEAVYAVEPLYCSVVVSGTAIDSGLDEALTSEATTAVNGYFAGLGFGDPAQSTSIIAAVANQVAGSVSSLGIQLLNVSGVVVNNITPSGKQRMILQNLAVSFN